MSILDLYVGAVVRLNHRVGRGCTHGMNKYRGKPATVVRIRDSYFNIKEDGRRWCWHAEDIGEVIGDASLVASDIECDVEGFVLMEYEPGTLVIITSPKSSLIPHISGGRRRECLGELYEIVSSEMRYFYQIKDAVLIYELRKPGSDYSYPLVWAEDMFEVYEECDVDTTNLSGIDITQLF